MCNFYYFTIIMKVPIIYYYTGIFKQKQAEKRISDIDIACSDPKIEHKKKQERIWKVFLNPGSSSDNSLHSSSELCLIDKLSSILNPVIQYKNIIFNSIKTVVILCCSIYLYTPTPYKYTSYAL